MKNYYDILGVQKGASDAEIKKAFRSQAQKYHPDKQGGDEARFKELSEAYAVLGDKKKRAEYDTYGHTFAGGGGQGGFGAGGFDFSQFQQGFGQGGVEFDLGDIFGDIFGGGGKREQRGRDVSIDIELDFKDAAFGVTRTILLNKTNTCQTCTGSGAKAGSEMVTCTACNGNGSIREARRSLLGTVTSTRICGTCNGKAKVPKDPCANCSGAGVAKGQDEITVAVPAGIANGEMIRMPGKGEAIAGGTPGDLYIKIHVAPHDTFTRSGNDLRMQLNVKLTDALLGSTYTVETLEGTIDLKVPAGVAHGEVLRARGKGITTQSGGAGDLLAQIHIDIPKKLSRSAKKLIAQLQEEGI